MVRVTVLGCRCMRGLLKVGFVGEVIVAITAVWSVEEEVVAVGKLGVGCGVCCRLRI